MSRLREALAPEILPVVLANLTTRYPFHDSHLARAGEPAHEPFAAHPAFGNSFDWHSSVHSHWTALQLIEHFAARGDGGPHELTQLRSAVAENLRAEKLAAEGAYLETHAHYERPYGWAWALVLTAAVQRSWDAALRAWGAPLCEIAASIAGAAEQWLRALPIPVRHGVHSNTAFALGLMHDATAPLGLNELREQITQRSVAWFGGDKDWPIAWERSGNDFLSPGLAEADLMRRVLARDEFAAWWRDFLPKLTSDSPELAAAEVPNVSDGQIVHLHGLNLSRAAGLARIATALSEQRLLERARSLYTASVERAAGGHYSETHWLPTFAWDAAASLDAACEE